MRKHTSWLAVCLLALAPALAATPAPLEAQGDPVVQKIIEFGTTDNQVMKWADYATNRFGGRISGSDAYNNASAWAVWQFEQWGLEAHLDPVGEVPVGFNRGPWFGRMMAPTEHALYFGTPSFTAGTKGLQRGRAVILETDPFSIPSRGPSPEDIEAKRVAVAAAVAEVNADPSRFDGAWVLIAGLNSGFARDGRRDTPEYSDSWLMPPLTQALLDAGAFGTVQKSGDPIRILDGFASSWEELPELPDIKLVDTHYDEIRALVEAGTPVELEFDIRNWFKMGPVKYDNVVAVIRGTTYPDEYVVLGSHFDSFDGSTGAVDAVSGVSPHMEAMRLIAAAGGAPKRSIAIILFAAEEIGLVGSRDWVADNSELHDKIVVMVNRDGSPSAIAGVTVPPKWYQDFQGIAAPLADLDPRWPFEVHQNDYPSPVPTRAGGSDHASFAMEAIPILSFRNQSDYSYGRAWHTLYDIYSELVPYTDHQKHSAVVTAVVAYGIANLDEPLTRDGVYLPDGLFADITTSSGARVITTLDFENAPLQTANFIRIIEGNEGQATGGGRGFGRQAATPAIGTVTGLGGGIAGVVIDSEAQRSAAVENLPLGENPAVKHDGPGVLGMSGANTFYLTLEALPDLDGTYTALGKVVAGAHTLGDIAAGDGIRRIRILRSGEAALAFATDDEAFSELMRRARQR